MAEDRRTLRPKYGSRPAETEHDVPPRREYGEGKKPIPRSSTISEADERRLLSEVDRKIAGMIEGISSQVRTQIVEQDKRFDKKLDGKLGDILTAIDDMRIDQARYRSRREEKEEGEKSTVTDLKQTLDLLQQVTGIRSIEEKRSDEKIESARRYRIALWTIFVPIILALVALVGAAIGSHFKPM